MSSVATAPISHPGWLRSPRYDSALIGGVLAIALLSGVAVIMNPTLFPLILFIDLWFLGYHHVISTFTRLCFDKQSLRQHTFLVFGLPPLVLAGTLGIAFGIGIWTITTVYLYWQWFHYTRQSWGISQVYRLKSDGRVDDGYWFARLTFYLLPAWGILYRSWQAPETFIGIELKVIPVPGLLVQIVGAAAFASLILWLYTRFKAWREGRLAPAHTLFMLSHFTVFLVGYWLIESITYGWLVINVWHNAQYILFVWLYNTNRYSKGIDPEARFLSWLSQPQRFLSYFFICVAISSVLYYGIDSGFRFLDLFDPSYLIIIYMTVNFHHYIVDSVIWKVRKKPLQKNLGLKT